MIKLAVLAPHPIQYHAPLYRSLAARSDLDLHVLFMSDLGLVPSHDVGFGRRIQFDVPLTEGFSSEILRNFSGRPEQLGFASRVNPSVLSRLSALQADVTLVHGYEYLSNWLVFLAEMLTGKYPYMLRGESRLATGKRWGRRAVRRTALSRLVRSARACLPIGLENAKFYLSHGAPPESLFMAPYSVDNERFSATSTLARSDRERILHSLGLSPSNPTILFAAKFQSWKRPDDLLQAFCSQRRPANLLLVGDGPLLEGCRSRYANVPGVRFLGFRNQTEMPQWYGVSDILVMPSDHEPWGLAVNEAMASGVVPVVSDAVGARPDLVNALTGRSYPPGDTVALAETLEQLLESPELLARLRVGALARVADYSIERTCDGIAAAAEYALTQKPKGPVS